ncbi:MAG: hypothetical protein KZQ95_21760, partial [Candidatus Thiodiazotropha sp. (ex Epidulcina cf. delphinae)]|nr:hypothetical protein [Candidatus Thiodiazotropha sp. (ex Epidulcina cf. delphinae)]
QKLLKLMEEQLGLARQKRFGSSSEKLPFQGDFFESRWKPKSWRVKTALCLHPHAQPQTVQGAGPTGSVHHL